MADPILGPVTDGDSFKVILFQTLYNQKLMNVLHYVCSAPGATPPDRFTVCKSLAGALIDPTIGIFTQMRANLSNDLTQDSVRVQFIKEVDFSYPFWEELIGEPGEIAQPATLANTVLSIEKRAHADPAHPREGIGRMQIGGVPAEKYTAGSFFAAYLDDWANIVQDMADPVVVNTDVTLLPCLSRPGATVWIDNPIFQCGVKETVRCMTRRTVGRGQ